jgi:hypothetical protein
MLHPFKRGREHGPLHQEPGTQTNRQQSCRSILTKRKQLNSSHLETIRIRFDYPKINALTGPRELGTDEGREGQQAKLRWNVATQKMEECMEWQRWGSRGIR